MNNGKVRIYELSKELELENKDILAICDKLNIAVKSHSSTITEEDATKIKEVAKLLDLELDRADLRDQALNPAVLPEAALQAPISLGLLSPFVLASNKS
ncbi:MAG: translation initiation factor IF-2 N-terminal domain-containing protein [Cyanobacteria bacterium J06632_3]